MKEPKVVRIDPREFLSPIKKISSYTHWDKALNSMQLLDEQQSLNLREKFGSITLFKAFDTPEVKIYYYEAGSIFEPEHVWIRNLIEDGLIRVAESQPGHYMEPGQFAAQPPVDDPIFYYVSKSIYDRKKEDQPDSRAVEMYENWPIFTRYELVITKRAERKMELLAQAQNMESVLGKQPTTLSDAVSIEVPFGFGKVDVLKLWQYFKSS